MTHIGNSTTLGFPRVPSKKGDLPLGKVENPTPREFDPVVQAVEDGQELKNGFPFLQNGFPFLGVLVNTNAPGS